MNGYSIWIIGEGNTWELNVRSTEAKIDHARTRRTYSSAGDAATSLRHLLNELEPRKPASSKPALASPDLTGLPFPDDSDLVTIREASPEPRGESLPRPTAKRKATK